MCAKHVADNPLLKINIPLSGLVLEARVERFIRLLVNSLTVDLEKDSRPNLVVQARLLCCQDRTADTLLDELELAFSISAGSLAKATGLTLRHGQACHYTEERHVKAGKMGSLTNMLELGVRLKLASFMALGYR